MRLIFFFLFVNNVLYAQDLTLSGTVTERESGFGVKGAEVKLMGSDKTTVEVLTDSAGHYIFPEGTLQPNTAYIISVSGIKCRSPQWGDGLLGNPRRKFDTYGSVSKFVIDLDLLKVLACEPIVRIVFKKNSVGFNEPADSNEVGCQRSVNYLIQTMKENPNIVIELRGHASKDEKDAEKLSQDRVVKIRDLVLAAGIDKERIVIIAFGSSKPLQNVDIPEKEKYNSACRRVTFSVLRKDYKPTK
jgi:outer membrane protein OmpA-like peptidoglycan-associated protein